MVNLTLWICWHYLWRLEGNLTRGIFFSLCCSYHANISQVIRSFFSLCEKFPSFLYLLVFVYQCHFENKNNLHRFLSGFIDRAASEYPSTLSTCVGVPWRTRYITIVAIRIQWDANKWTGILEFSALTQNFTHVISNTKKKK